MGMVMTIRTVTGCWTLEPLLQQAKETDMAVENYASDTTICWEKKSTKWFDSGIAYLWKTFRDMLLPRHGETWLWLILQSTNLGLNQTINQMIMCYWMTHHSFWRITEQDKDRYDIDKSDHSNREWVTEMVIGLRLG